MEKNLKASQKRALQYWFADGLTELSGAAICLLLTIYFVIQQILAASKGYFVILFFIVFVAAFGVRKLMLSYRERSTYQRTGYVEPRKGMEDRRFLGIAIGFTVLLLGFMLFTILRGIQTMVWMPVIAGVIFGFIFILVGLRTKLMRFYFLVVFCFLMGVFLSLSGLGDMWGAALLSLVTGLVLLAFGIVTRLTYIRQTNGIAEPADER
jgi:hypothetical protein